jgi:hypothetical protein
LTDHHGTPFILTNRLVDTPGAAHDGAVNEGGDEVLTIGEVPLHDDTVALDDLELTAVEGVDESLGESDALWL